MKTKPFSEPTEYNDPDFLVYTQGFTGSNASAVPVSRRNIDRTCTSVPGRGKCSSGRRDRGAVSTAPPWAVPAETELSRAPDLTLPLSFCTFHPPAKPRRFFSVRIRARVMSRERRGEEKVMRNAHLSRLCPRAGAQGRDRAGRAGAGRDHTGSHLPSCTFCLLCPRQQIPSKSHSQKPQLLHPEAKSQILLLETWETHGEMEGDPNLTQKQSCRQCPLLNFHSAEFIADFNQGSVSPTAHPGLAFLF